MLKNEDIPELIRVAGSEHKGWIRAAGRLMSLAENSPKDTTSLLAELASAPEPRIVLGITGAPGSGKSLLTDRLITVFRKTYPDRRIGVIAIDPSSPFSGGALLGDRIRMMRHSVDPFVFIRSSATRGNIGGITLGTLGVLRIMGLIGCDLVLIETVGVGQSEFEVREVADMTAVVLAPGQGDAIQFLKAGLMEIGNMFIVNKADSPDAESFFAEVSDALRFIACAKGVLEPVKPFLVSARTGTGITQALQHIETCCEREEDIWTMKRQEKLETRIRRVILDEARKQTEAAFNAIVHTSPVGRVLSGTTSVSDVVGEIFKEISSS